MDKTELIEMIISERIGALLEQKVKEEAKEAVSGREERILEGLEEEKKIQIETYIDSLVEEAAQNERIIYRGGFYDGAGLVMWLCREGRNGFREKEESPE